MIDRFRFDSEAHTPEEAFDAYRKLYAIGSDVERGEGSFFAWVRAVRLDGLLLFERRLNAVIHSRAQRAGVDSFGHFALHMVLDGVLEGSPESRFERAERGDLVLVDTRRASRTEARDLHVLTASVPRATVATACGSSEGLHGRGVSAPRTHVLRDLMQSLVRNADGFQPEALPGLRRAFNELLQATMVDLGGGAPPQLRVDLARREAAQRFIVARLADRELDATRVAAGIGASRSALYRLFAAEGGVAHFIMTRRLAAVRNALDAGSTEPLSVLAEAHGFTDESHLNRRFNRAYGQPAGAYRRAVAERGRDEVAAMVARWNGWMVEVS